MQKQVTPYIEKCMETTKEKTREAFSRFLLVYFVFSIGVLGFIFVWASALPLLWLGRFWKSAHLLGGRVLCAGVHTLLAVQPWLKSRVEISLPNIKRNHPRGYLSVSNHRSHLDMFFLLARIPNMRVVAKSSLFSVPFLGSILRVMRDISVERGSAESYLKALEMAEQGLRQGDWVHIFPEGGRCPEGFSGTQRFQLSVFHLAKRTQVSVVPVVFIDTDLCWPKGKTVIRFRQLVKVKSLPPIDPNQFDSAKALMNETQRQINQTLEQHREKATQPALTPVTQTL